PATPTHEIYTLSLHDALPILMKFYKENQINPAASCLPMLAQFPVFIALYLVLRKFAKHPPPGDLSWLHGFVPNIAAHASAHWSGYVLLALYVATQLVLTVLMSATMDKAQRTMLLVLPLTFVFFLINFPTGLVLYWVTTNLWTVGQGKWTARGELEKLRPGIDKSAVQFQVLSEGERGLLGVGFSPARVIASVPDAGAPAAEPAPAPADEGELAGEVREVVERVVEAIEPDRKSVV